MPCRTLASIVGCLFICITGACTSVSDESVSQPSPDLKVDQALSLQLEALKTTGNTRRGVAQMFAFASPKSRKMMGSYEAFATLIQTHLTPLLGHRSSQTVILEESDIRVRYQVTVTDGEGEERHYEWVLENMPTPACQFCWLNTYIHPMETPEKGTTIEI